MIPYLAIAVVGREARHGGGSRDRAGSAGADRSSLCRFVRRLSGIRDVLRCAVDGTDIDRLLI